jgi:hypothetical protein
LHASAFLVAFAIAWPCVAGTVAPCFEDFANVESFTGTAAPVDLKSTPDARRFRTRLREGAAAGPNFAGHFTIVSWGCGTDCQVIAMVNALNGAVVFAPFVSELGQEFRLGSRLLVLNPPKEVESYLGDIGGCAQAHPPTWVVTRYYEWDGKQFRLVAESPACGTAK